MTKLAFQPSSVSR